MHEVIDLFEEPDIAVVYAAHRVEDLAETPEEAAAILESAIKPVQSFEVRRALLSKLSELYEQAGNREKAIECCVRIIEESSAEFAYREERRGN
jgi:tetratricopeptide (TPR) repeat protein